jgi:spore maturation protein CgeB
LTVRRIAVLGAGGAYRTPAAIARGAMSLGLVARVFDTLGWARRLGPLAPSLLRRRIDAFVPDLLLLTVDAMALGEETLTLLTRRIDSAFWHFDGQWPPSPKALTVAGLAARTFTTYLPLVDEFRRRGAAEAHFLPQGVDPEVDRPANPPGGDAGPEVLFIGSGQYPYRVDLLREIAENARLAIRGLGWDSHAPALPVVGGKIAGPAFARAVNGAAIVLGAHASPELAEYRASASNRMWKVLGCGGFYLGPWVADIDHFARGGEHCAWYRDTADAIRQIRFWLDRPEERQHIALAGRAHALARHTYAHRLELLLTGRSYTFV